MNEQATTHCTAFDGERLIASGDLRAVALATKETLDRGATGRVMIFDDATGKAVELDLRGTSKEVAERVDSLQVGMGPTDQGPVNSSAGAGEASVGEASAGEASRPRRGPGRPRLGVVSKEVTLLPRHWAWLGAQRGGASAALRRLVDESRRANVQQDQARSAQDAAYRFMWDTLGDQVGFEEAMRALFAGDGVRFEAETQDWPTDLRDYSRQLAAGAFRRPPGDEHEHS